MAVLITGGAGFLGIHLARALVSRGDEVVLGDIGSFNVPDDLKGKVKSVACDVSSAADFFEAVDGTQVDGIYHLAVAIRTTAELNPAAAYRVNVEGAGNLLEVARTCSVKRVVFISSHSVFPPGTKVVGLDTRPMQYANTYGIAKIFGEQMGLYYHHRYGLDFRAVRFCAINGPGRPFIGGTSFVSQLFHDIVKTRRFVMPTKETTSFHNMYVQDAVRCLIGLYDAAPEQIRTRIYNIAGIPTTMKELATTIRRHLPDAVFDYQPDEGLLREFESWPHTVDDTQARKEWGWDINWDLDKWVADFLAAEKNACQLIEENGT